MGQEPKKRSLTIAGHATSVSLEEPFWRALNDVAEAEGRTVPSLVAEVDARRSGAGLSSALRIFLLDYYRQRASGAGAGGTD